MRARLVILPAVAALAFMAMSGPAGAKTRGGGGAFIGDGGDPTAEATDASSGGTGGGGGPGTPDPCRWEVVVEDDFALTVYGVDGGVQHSTTGRWLQKVCPGSGAVEVGGRFLIPEGGLVDVGALADQALASVTIAAPGLHTSPDAGGRLYVQVPTWLWIDGDWWHGYQATASAGRVSATVTARPVQASWALGDGGAVACNGPGVAWQPGLSESATTCSHTYTTSSAGSPGGTFTLSATVTFEVTWTSNVGDAGTLPAINRSSSRPVEVREIQAIGTGS